MEHSAAACRWAPRSPRPRHPASLPVAMEYRMPARLRACLLALPLLLQPPLAVPLGLLLAGGADDRGGRPGALQRRLFPAPLRRLFPHPLLRRPARRAAHPLHPRRLWRQRRLCPARAQCPPPLHPAARHQLGLGPRLFPGTLLRGAEPDAPAAAGGDASGIAPRHRSPAPGHGSAARPRRGAAAAPRVAAMAVAMPAIPSPATAAGSVTAASRPAAWAASPRATSASGAASSSATS